MFKKQYCLMEEAGDTSSGGGGGDTVAGAAGADTIAAAAGADTLASGAADDKTALGQGAQTPTIPEKYQVKKEDGTIDEAATLAKFIEGHGNLEKRVGSGDLPPKTAEEYKITVPETLKDWKPEDDPLLQEFKKDAHAAGMNQKQFDFVMDKYFKMAPELVNASRVLDAEACVAELKTQWKTDEQYKGEVNKAYKAAVGYFGADADAIIKEYGNDPRIIRGLAKLGSEMGEDKALNFDGGGGGQASIDAIMTSEAYNNPRHADHAKVSGQVRVHFEKLAAAAEKAGAVPVM